MKHLLSNLRFLWFYWAFVAGGACAQNPSEGMNRFVDGLMKKMTLDEKIGQLRSGRAVQPEGCGTHPRGAEGGNGGKPFGHPVAFWDGRHTRIRDGIPHSAGIIVHVGHEGSGRVGTHCRCGGQCRRHLLDIQPDGGPLPRPSLGTNCRG